jgi:hypothetical protein
MLSASMFRTLANTPRTAPSTTSPTPPAGDKVAGTSGSGAGQMGIKAGSTLRRRQFSLSRLHGERWLVVFAAALCALSTTVGCAAECTHQAAPDKPVPTLPLPSNIPPIPLPSDIPTVPLPSDVPPVHLPSDIPIVQLPADVPAVQLPSAIPIIQLPSEIPPIPLPSGIPAIP